VKDSLALPGNAFGEVFGLAVLAGVAGVESEMVEVFICEDVSGGDVVELDPEGRKGNFIPPVGA